MKYIRFLDKNNLSPNIYIMSSICIITIFIIFIFFSYKLKSFPLNFNTLLVSTSLSILIGYQLIMIDYLSSNIKKTFVKLKPLFEDNRFFDYLEEKMKKSTIYYSIILLIIIPFILLEFIRYFRWKSSIGRQPSYFIFFEPSNYWAILFDIINHMIGYLMLFLLAIIVWRIIILIIIIKSFNNYTSFNVDIFHVDEMAGLRPLRDFILIVIINYFLIITLAIFSYISPVDIISYETIFLIFLLFLGIVLFIIALKTIIQQINRGLESQVIKINEEYKQIYNKLINIPHDESYEFTKNELETLSYFLEILEKEKKKIKGKSYRKLTVNTITTFISSFLIPLITLIEKLIGKDKLINMISNLFM